MSPRVRAGGKLYDHLIFSFFSSNFDIFNFDLTKMMSIIDIIETIKRMSLKEWWFWHSILQYILHLYYIFM